jgi:Fe-Mn family superoxide dismutase
MFTEQKFAIPDLNGISKKTVDEHLKLYAGYVKHANLILEKIAELGTDEKLAYAVSEMQRRFGFEYNGMKNHEYYFKLLENGPKAIGESSALKKAIETQWGSYDAWLTRFKTVAMTRGIGWAILYYDKDSKQLVNAWIDEQHLGQLNSTQFIFGIDMWEHSYMLDYAPSEKKKYVDAFLENANWAPAESWFTEASSTSMALSS